MQFRLLRNHFYNSRNICSSSGSGDTYHSPQRQSHPGRPGYADLHIHAARNLKWFQGLDTLHRHAALEAIYDSAESFPQPRCHPETRIKMLDDLCRRLNDPGIRVIWLHGA
ncbi:hypothetical protein FB45DRAFT_757223, partial [Roridomyces roridus]